MADISSMHMSCMSADAHIGDVDHVCTPSHAHCNVCHHTQIRLNITRRSSICSNTIAHGRPVSDYLRLDPTVVDIPRREGDSLVIFAAHAGVKVK